MEPEVPQSFRRRKEDQSPRKLRNGLYILPSLFTTANIAAGYYAILQRRMPRWLSPGTSITLPRRLGLRSYSMVSMAASLVSPIRRAILDGNSTRWPM